jgi:hypothetical protein
MGFSSDPLRREIAAEIAVDRSNHRRHRGFGHFVAINRRFQCASQRKGCRGPDRPSIHLGFGLQHGNAPHRRSLLDRPIERRWTAIADDAGMHDQTNMARPDRFGNRPLEERRQNQIRSKQRHRLFIHRIGNVEFDADFVAALAQFAKKALGQTVEAVRYE